VKKLPLSGKQQQARPAAPDPLQQLMKPGAGPRALLKAKTGGATAKKSVGKPGGRYLSDFCKGWGLLVQKVSGTRGSHGRLVCPLLFLLFFLLRNGGCRIRYHL
jgi:hypothetical protein